jgi:hypothetical protein
MMARFLVTGRVILLFLRSSGRRSLKTSDAVEMYGVFLL